MKFIQRRKSPDNSIKIIGIDPGSVCVGYAILEACGERLSVPDYGVIYTRPREPGKRLDIIHRSLCRILQLHNPSLAAIEELFFSKNQKTAMRVSESRGVIFLALHQHNISIREFSPPYVKLMITGYGHAEKPQVQRMIQSLLGLPRLPQPDDAADALAVALCCVRVVQSGRRMQPV